ncbi:MAG: hypothetical protein M1819_000941 [Sarea resinae]|nr:MAG: hypothetical protein M1819_000941 [Sarea resinae]
MHFLSTLLPFLAAATAVNAALQVKVVVGMFNDEDSYPTPVAYAFNEVPCISRVELANYVQYSICDGTQFSVEGQNNLTLQGCPAVGSPPTQILQNGTVVGNCSTYNTNWSCGACASSNENEVPSIDGLVVCG